jgi:hypothetical protein
LTIAKNYFHKDIKDFTSTDDVETYYDDSDVVSYWNSEDVTVTENKSLSNKMINAANNYAYGSEIEYILYGGSNDDNVSKAYTSIYALRYLLNATAGFLTFWNLSGGGNAYVIETGTLMQATAVAIAAGTGGIIPRELVLIVEILIEIARETGRDIAYLKAGLPVKLVKVKDDSTWGENVSKYADGAVNFSYRDYLYMFTLLGFYSDKADAMYARIGDVIQANMRHIIGSAGSSYKLSNSIVYFKFEATLRVKPLMLALPIASDIEGNPKDNTDWCTFTYTTVRGY